MTRERSRNWSENSLKRPVPLLPGLSRIVACFELRVEQPRRVLLQWPRHKKAHVIFIDRLRAALADIWVELLLQSPRMET